MSPEIVRQYLHMELCCQTPNQCSHCRIKDGEDALLRPDMVCEDVFCQTLCNLLQHKTISFPLPDFGSRIVSIRPETFTARSLSASPILNPHRACSSRMRRSLSGVVL